jgi:hypothetical protein
MIRLGRLFCLGVNLASFAERITELLKRGAEENVFGYTTDGLRYGEEHYKV